jgi:hypothetical protein
MSRYRDNGYEIPRTKRTMIARLSVRSQRKDISRSEGNKELKTCGIVSPIIIQNAIMPPKAKAH